MYRTTLRIFKEFPPEHYKRALCILAEFSTSAEIVATVDGDTLVQVEIDSYDDWKLYCKATNRTYTELFVPLPFWYQESEASK
jgi:hypothetical protein